jgi:hypothetical protein
LLLKKSRLPGGTPIYDVIDRPEWTSHKENLQPTHRADGDTDAWALVALDRKPLKKSTLHAVEVSTAIVVDDQ